MYRSIANIPQQNLYIIYNYEMFFLVFGVVWMIAQTLENN